MGILSTLITLPITGPMKGSLWTARKIHEAAEQQFLDPASIRAELTRLESLLLAGEISDDVYDAAEFDLLKRLQAASK